MAEPARPVPEHLHTVTPRLAFRIEDVDRDELDRRMQASAQGGG
jgi:hypothetical protein